MIIKVTTNDISDRTEKLVLEATQFQDEKILKNLSRIFIGGGELIVKAADGYEGTITYPPNSSKDIDPE